MRDRSRRARTHVARQPKTRGRLGVPLIAGIAAVVLIAAPGIGVAYSAAPDPGDDIEVSEAVLGSVSWSVTDEEHNRLGDTTWEIRSGNEVVRSIADCVANSSSECLGKADENPAEGQFLTEGLELGTYSLVQVGAPVDFVAEASAVEFAVTETKPTAKIKDPVLNRMVEPEIIEEPALLSEDPGEEAAEDPDEIEEEVEEDIDEPVEEEQVEEDIDEPIEEELRDEEGFRDEEEPLSDRPVENDADAAADGGAETDPDPQRGDEGEGEVEGPGPGVWNGPAGPVNPDMRTRMGLFSTSVGIGAIQAQMQNHIPWSAWNGGSAVSYNDCIRYGILSNSSSSNTAPNTGGSNGTNTSPEYNRNGNTAWVGNGNTAYSAHGSSSSNSCPTASQVSLNVQSALGFSPSNVTQVAPGTIFNIGRMVHVNNPVQITGQYYRGNLNVNLSNLNRQLTFTWRMNETTNFPGDVDDITEFLNVTDQGGEFVGEDGITYNLVIYGFTAPQSGNQCTQTLSGDLGQINNRFVTPERTVTYGCLYGSLEQVRSLTIEKKVLPADLTAQQIPSFPFTATSQTAGSLWNQTFNLQPPSASSSAKQGPQRFMSSEDARITEGTLPPHWELLGVECTDGKGTPLESGVTVNLNNRRVDLNSSLENRIPLAQEPDEVPITCTFTNRLKQLPKITLQKEVNNEFAGNLGSDAEDWTLKAAKTGTVVQGPGAGSGQVDGAQVDPGTYSLTEDGPVGYRWDDLVCTDKDGTELPSSDLIVVKDTTGVTSAQLSLDYTDDVTCIFKNEAKPGSVTWAKVDQNGQPLAGSEWEITSTAPAATMQVTDNTGDPSYEGKDEDPNPGAFRVSNLSWGEYSLAETLAPPGYRLENVDEAFSVGPASLTHTFGEAFVNSELATVNVAKKWVVNGATYDHGDQPAGMGASLVIDPSGEGTNEHPDWGEVRSGYVIGDQVTIGESVSMVNAGCVLDSAQLTGTGLDVPVNLTAAGHAVTLPEAANEYTITNTVTCTQKLTLIKTVDNKGYGADDLFPTDWRIPASGWDLFATPDGGTAMQFASGETKTVAVGTYSLTEQDHDGYTFKSLTCDTATPDSDGNIAVGLGESVTCTFTNEIQPGDVVWSKVVGGQTTLLPGSQWELGGPGGIKKTITDQSTPGEFSVTGLAWGDYKLTETMAPPGYKLLTEPITFRVDVDSISVDLSGISNTQQDGPRLPLTGGIGRDQIYVAGATVLIIGLSAFGAVRLRRRNLD